jgi:methylenetetrahydrofolate dehydrogenase (NADP+)/methenyltetrahydrofolate cyclohydrolase
MIIDGKKEAALLREEIKKEISSIKEKHNKTPGLSVILIGNFAPSLIYVNNKEKNSKDVGINSEVIRYSENVTEKEVLNKIDELNKNESVSGILVQLPLPDQINKEKIINAIWMFTFDKKNRKKFIREARCYNWKIQFKW